MSSVSLAVQRNPTLLPRPGGFAGPEHAHAGDLQALRGYLQEHRQDSRISFLLPLVSHISLTPLTSFPLSNMFYLGQLSYSENPILFRSSFFEFNEIISAGTGN